MAPLSSLGIKGKKDIFPPHFLIFKHINPTTSKSIQMNFVIFSTQILVYTFASAESVRFKLTFCS